MGREGSISLGRAARSARGFDQLGAGFNQLDKGVLSAGAGFDQPRKSARSAGEGTRSAGEGNKALSAGEEELDQLRKADLDRLGKGILSTYAQSSITCGPIGRLSMSLQFLNPVIIVIIKWLNPMSHREASDYFLPLVSISRYSFGSK